MNAFKPKKIPLSELPAPRLQLRWQKLSETRLKPRFGQNDYVCHYELVMPYREHDIRAENSRYKRVRETFTLKMKPPSIRGCGVDNVPCYWRTDPEPYFDPPFRDGAHARWDSELLGNLPIYVITPDGFGLLQPTEEEYKRVNG